MVGLNSPWGVFGAIKDKRGWTMEQVLWQEPWQNIVLELADQARYETGKQYKEVESLKDLRTTLGR